MIRYQDFAPEKTAAGGFFKMPTFESLDECVAQANRWIEDNQLELINVETVVLPNMHISGEEGTSDVSLHTSGDMMSNWHQFVRVWYRTDKSTPPPI
ncbi:hypothetical protein [Cerasicoccus arenae]|uniref:Uncharacterized protein n=1 Tax=Cerasicoccus arenae TaxID=424488 RepID=A0A8J3DAT9_9BACT|nr:hypothetical protein [Cerasicoccus arenae]MBK1858725.1 hypothetical protein [Cerasicoccus arenae]GHB98522.1 hypothetical protein GCM10007047_13350 [Cerasicoccus arenae]